MNTNINANELKNWIRTNYASQVVPKSFAGMMIQAITDRIDQMATEVQGEAPAQTKMGVTTGELVPEEDEIGVEERPEPVIQNEAEIKEDAQRWVKRRRRH